MRYVNAMMALLLFALLSTTTPGQTHPKKDQELIQGAWEVSESIARGTALPDDIRKELRFAFKGDKLTVTGEMGTGSIREYSFKLDQTKSPKAIDTTALTGPHKGKTVPAIYELNGDILKICIPNEVTSERPNEFKAPKEKNQCLFVLKRQKK